ARPARPPAPTPQGGRRRTPHPPPPPAPCSPPPTTRAATTAPAVPPPTTITSLAPVRSITPRSHRPNYLDVVHAHPASACASRLWPRSRAVPDPAAPGRHVVRVS